jgi:hypothetical protein
MDEMKALEPPFDSIESAQQYLTLLCGSVDDATLEIAAALKAATKQSASRREQALRLAAFNLVKLKNHVTGSLRALNDLRMLRRLILAERMPAAGRKPEVQPVEV